MATIDVMVDLETMSTRANGAFVSIGAVAFDPYGDRVSHTGPWTFYRNVDLESAMDAGLRVDASTVMWWMDDRKADKTAARAGLFNPDPVPLGSALADFSSWYAGLTQFPSCVWAHGATFDPVLIAEAYAHLGRKAPWFFSNVNDTRTIYRHARMKLPAADGRKGGHNSLADAIAQAEHLQKCFKSMNGTTQQAVFDGPQIEIEL